MTRIAICAALTDWAEHSVRSNLIEKVQCDVSQQESSAVTNRAARGVKAVQKWDTR